MCVYASAGNKGGADERNDLGVEHTADNKGSVD